MLRVCEVTKQMEEEVQHSSSRFGTAVEVEVLSCPLQGLALISVVTTFSQVT